MGGDQEFSNKMEGADMWWIKKIYFSLLFF